MTFVTILNFIKRYYWIVQGVIILALVFFLKKERKKTEDYQEVYNLQQVEIKRWKDDAGRNRIRADVAEIDAANAKLVLESNLQETIRKEVGNLKRNLNKLLICSTIHLRDVSYQFRRHHLCTGGF